MFSLLGQPIPHLPYEEGGSKPRPEVSGLYPRSKLPYCGLLDASTQHIHAVEPGLLLQLLTWRQSRQPETSKTPTMTCVDKAIRKTGTETLHNSGELPPLEYSSIVDIDKVPNESTSEWLSLYPPTPLLLATLWSSRAVRRHCALAWDIVHQHHGGRPNHTLHKTGRQQSLVSFG